MDLIFGLVGGVLLTVLLAMVVVAWITLRNMGNDAPTPSATTRVAYSTLDDAPAPPAPTPTEPRTCAGCARFDLVAGQKVMALNPAFRAASEVIPPWRMGRVLKTRPNPEHADCLAAIEAATSDVARTALHARLETLPPEVPLDAEEQVEAPILALEWSQFGACGHHQELRASSDVCPTWTRKLSS